MYHIGTENLRVGGSIPSLATSKPQIFQSVAKSASLAQDENYSLLCQYFAKTKKRIDGLRWRFGETSVSPDCLAVYWIFDTSAIGYTSNAHIDNLLIIGEVSESMTVGYLIFEIYSLNG